MLILLRQLARPLSAAANTYSRFLSSSSASGGSNGGKTGVGRSVAGGKYRQQQIVFIDSSSSNIIINNNGEEQKTPLRLISRTYSTGPPLMFEKAVQDVKKLPDEPDNDTKLELYALYKQASVGDVQGSRPKMMDFVARAKYDAWNKNKGISKEEAQHQYIALVYKLLKEAGVDPTAATTEASPEGKAADGGSIADWVRVSRQGKVFRIELNRPEKFNALSYEMYDAIVNALEASNQCRQTSITVFTGIGEYYCAGNDLSNFARNIKTQADMVAMADRAEGVLDRFVTAHIQHQKPLISLVNGPAIGISVTVMALYDRVIASNKATFHTPFSSLGQSPEGCSSYTFPLLMGASKASEMLLFDKKITAEEAVERNLISQVIPHASFHTETERLIAEMSELPPESLRVNKQLLRDVHRDALLRVCKHQCAVLKQRWLSAECQEALMKFRGRKAGGSSSKL